MLAGTVLCLGCIIPRRVALEPWCSCFILYYFYVINVKRWKRTDSWDISLLFCNFMKNWPVLRIRDVCLGSEFFHPGSRVKHIPDPGFASKNLSIFNPKNCLWALGKMNWDVQWFIPDPNFFPSQIQGWKKPRIPDPDPQHWNWPALTGPAMEIGEIGFFFSWL